MKVDIQCEFSHDDKVYKCKADAVMDINRISNNNLYELIKNDIKWLKLVKRLHDNPALHIIDNKVYASAEGVAICHDDDGFDENLGKIISRDRAIKKIYKLMSSVLMDVHHIVDDHQKNTKYQVISCLRKLHKIDDNLTKICNMSDKNYWNNDERT